MKNIVWLEIRYLSLASRICEVKKSLFAPAIRLKYKVKTIDMQKHKDHAIHA